MSSHEPLFATCAPGLEPLLHAEVKALRLPRSERQVGGVFFVGGELEIWRANLELRTAIRVLRRLARFACGDADTLYTRVRELPWERWLTPGGSLVVDAQSKDSQLSHTLFIQQRTKDAIVDRLVAVRGERPSVQRDGADMPVHVHLFGDRATVSLDSSGPSLHKRGWRVHQGRAPLAETLAAAVVELSGWNGRAPFVDPFAGSGTLLVEAGHRAMGRAPGLERRFAFESWPEHDAKGWQALRDRARERVRMPRKLRLIGSDNDPERVREARENLAAAGVDAIAELSVCDAREVELRRGWNANLVSNLPYGIRIGGGDAEERALAAVMAGFGAHLREHCEGYGIALLSGNPRLSRALGLKASERIALLNGALPVELLRFEIHPKT